MVKALIVIDMTNDFVNKLFEHEGKEYEGKLVAPLGVTIIKPIEDLKNSISKEKGFTLLLQDLHNAETPEITSGKWPEHNMFGTPGAMTVDELQAQGTEQLYTKDYPSVFKHEGFLDHMKANKTEEVFITGLVQEVCVLQNTLGFLKNGYDKVYVVVDATVPFDEEAGRKALIEMEEAGAKLITVEEAKTLLGE